MRKTARLLELVLWILPAALALRLASLVLGVILFGVARVAAMAKSWSRKHGLG